MMMIYEFIKLYLFKFRLLLKWKIIFRDITKLNSPNKYQYQNMIKLVHLINFIDP